MTFWVSFVFRAPPRAMVLPQVDPEYPGTAVERMMNARRRASSLGPAELDGDWAEVRRHLLAAAGLRDITDAPPGQGNTSHAFNDYNHCDATCMLGDVAHNTNEGQVPKNLNPNQEQR